MARTQNIILQPRPNVKKINYLSKTFAEYRQNFIEFIRSYYPNTYSDFNESSPGMMFIELASYLGDVLSFYTDNQFKENLLAYADQPENIITIAQFLGYKPKLAASATAEVQLSLVAQSVLSEDGIQYIPNVKLLPTIKAGTIFSSITSQVQFILTEDIDFKQLTNDEFIASAYDSSGIPSEFLITKTGTVRAGQIKKTTFTFGSFQKFATAILPNEQIIGIENVVDSEGNKWYEVDYLAQDVILDDADTIDSTSNNTPEIKNLRMRRVPRRFVTRYTRDGRMQLMFGSGEANDAEQAVIVDSRQIATTQYGNTITSVVNNIALNNFNFLDSAAFGLSPSNTTLTVTYIVGGGVETNVAANTILEISDLKITTDISAFNSVEESAFVSSIQRLRVTNPAPATGGGRAETSEEIRQNALAFFNAQNRVVTAHDYVMRTYAFPPKYGAVAKAFAVKDEQLNAIMQFDGEQFVDNPIHPTAVNLYTLGYDAAGRLTTLNSSIKENLKKYLEQYRVMTDEVTILDAFIVNIAVQFNIVVFKSYNMSDVLARSIDAVRQYFDLSKWSINQPIVLADLVYTIGSVEGVQTVANVQITNKFQSVHGDEYQPYKYDIPAATVNGVIYPSLDPCIFEIKYPENDIIGTATT
jgi:hypothetical protein